MPQLDDLSLADFFFSESPDPLRADVNFTKWRRDARWAWNVYEPNMQGAPLPRLNVLRGGKSHKVVNLSSYNYMGFAKHPDVIKAAQEALETYGTGACGSPVLSGMTDLHAQLESELARFMQRESVMLYNSGFGGAMGSLAGVLRKGDVVIADSLVHLSLIAGATLSKARMDFFDHNNPEHLDALLKKHQGKRRLVVVEGVYSMDGDMADLPALLEVTRLHDVGIYIDEAHSILAWGEKGRGVHEYLGTQKAVDMVFATFSKSFAALGGFVAADASIIEYMKYYSHPYGFSCALPPSVVAGLLKVLELVRQDHAYQKRLHENADYFRARCQDMGLNTGNSKSQVIPIIIGSNRQALYELCLEMTEKGLFLAPVDYPSVPENALRYRVAITAAHTRQDLDDALQIIQDTIVKRLHNKVCS